MEEKFYKRINDQDIEHVMQFQRIERQIDDIQRTTTETNEKRSNSKNSKSPSRFQRKNMKGSHLTKSGKTLSSEEVQKALNEWMDKIEY